MEEKPKNDHIAVSLQEVRSLIAEDMDDAAMLRLKNILKQSPDNTEALLLYAQVSPNKDKAKKAISKILSNEPDNAEARLLLRRIEREEELTSNSSTQSTGIPTINIVNNNDNSNTVNASSSANATAIGIGGGALVDQGRNGTAFWVGLIAAFFGLFGIGYMINGKILIGLLYLFILGPIFLIFVFTLAATDGSLAVMCALPLFLIGIWQHAKAGAKRDPKLIPISFGR